MKADEILGEVDYLKLEGNLDIEVTGVCNDSREVQPGDIFCAIHGEVQNGHSFTEEAQQNGAALLVLEKEINGIETPCLIVGDTRRAFAIISQAVYNHPSRELFVTGITGTNGKTTTSYLAEKVLASRFPKNAVIGTLGIQSGSSLKKISLTTPESADLAKEMRTLVDGGTGAVVMEVSSHSLALSRVEGISFDVAVFTNISRDHLDFHRSFESYREMKLKLFRQLSESGKDSIGVINIDDPSSDVFKKACGVRYLTCSLKNPSADVFVERYYLSTEGTSIIFKSDACRYECIMSLLGRFNVQNAASAYAIGLAAGIPPAEIVKGIESVKKLRGRFEKIEGPGFDVFVDFAHTPDALENLLITARELAPKRIILVCGCGGNRDKSKRPLMGEIGARLADVLIITSDNPRMENPEKILDDIEAGARSIRDDLRRITSRKDAISEAVRTAEEGDTVLIAGKGHEDYQIIGTRRYPFDDKIEVHRVLKSLKEEQ